MKFGVVVFPGSNCEQDMEHVLSNVMDQEVIKIWHKSMDLDSFTPQDCIVLPGGFSYGDYLRSGAIARFSPIMKAVGEFAEAGGMVWGICNGFQILCEAGLLPGALLYNNNQKYVCKNIHLKTADPASRLTLSIPQDKVLKIPIAHGEGRYYADSDTLDQLEANQQILFQYCSPNGELGEAYNPNGSERHIAGIRNKAGNVYGMMPHPERASEAILGNEDGRYLFESMLKTQAAMV